jgi:hypothetical protein
MEGICDTAHTSLKKALMFHNEYYDNDLRSIVNSRSCSAVYFLLDIQCKMATVAKKRRRPKQCNKESDHSQEGDCDQKPAAKR